MFFTTYNNSSMLVATAAAPACTAFGPLAAGKGHIIALRAARPPHARWHVQALERTSGQALQPLVPPRQCPRRNPAVGASSSRSQGSSTNGSPTKELTFNVTSPDDYNHFEKNWVQKMREELGVASEHGVARLPVQVDHPESFMDLFLRAGQHEVTLRLRVDNLYVIGFRNGRGSWFEFAHIGGGRTLIQGSTSLGYRGGYQDRGGIGDLPQLDRAILGRMATENAIHGLARYDGGDNGNTEKYWLLTLIVNFVESVRLRCIAKRVGRAMSDNDPSNAYRHLTAENREAIRSWGQLSESFTMATDPALPQDVDRFRHFHSRGIYDAVAAATVLGMALLRRSRDSPRRLRRAAEDDDEEVSRATGGGGIVLAEVIGVLIKRINDYNPGRLYGTVSITDDVGTHQLFDRGTFDTQSVGPGGWAHLAWPPRAISGADDFVISVDLMDSNRVWFNREVARGDVAWNSREAVAGDYNRMVPVDVDGGYGSVQVQYAVLTDAVVAAVTVTVADEGQLDPDVYGVVTATTTTASGEHLTYKLFDKEARSDYVKVQKETPIPLQRMSVSAALGSPLQVHADLSDACMWPRDDKKIAHGSVSFTPRLAGSDSAQINGSSGMVTVTVTWSI